MAIGEEDNPITAIAAIVAAVAFYVALGVVTWHTAQHFGWCCAPPPADEARDFNCPHP